MNKPNEEETDNDTTTPTEEEWETHNDGNWEDDEYIPYIRDSDYATEY